jgi:hypothetical protein
MTKKGLAWVQTTLIDDKKIGEDLKKYAYSLAFQQGREEPVKVSSDVRAFLDMWCADVKSGDVKTIMGHFSDRFRHSGMNKVFYEQRFRSDPGITSCEPTVTAFEPRGDRAYVDGFNLVKPKGDANALKTPIGFQQIVNEHGEWKWFGNQK